MQGRLATPADAEAIARIYNQGIEDRKATFETSPRSAQEVAAWFDGIHPIVVIEENGEIVAFAATSEYRPRECYAGIAEASVYVERAWRRRGAGRLALVELIRQAEAAGFWKLVSLIFPENIASRSLIATLGFREAGRYIKHGRLDGAWRDVIIVERLIEANVK
jgi:phosphinothricin acetyltransferase